MTKATPGIGMGPSWRVFICGVASHGVFLVKQKNTAGWVCLENT